MDERLSASGVDNLPDEHGGELFQQPDGLSVRDGLGEGQSLALRNPHIPESESSSIESVEFHIPSPTIESEFPSPTNTQFQALTRVDSTKESGTDENSGSDIGDNAPGPGSGADPLVDGPALPALTGPYAALLSSLSHEDDQGKGSSWVIASGPQNGRESETVSPQTWDLTKPSVPQGIPCFGGHKRSPRNRSWDFGDRFSINAAGPIRVPSEQDFEDRGLYWPDDVGCRTWAETLNELNPHLQLRYGWTRLPGTEWGAHAWNEDSGGNVIDGYYDAHPSFNFDAHQLEYHYSPEEEDAAYYGEPKTGARGVSEWNLAKLAGPISDGTAAGTPEDSPFEVTIRTMRRDGYSEEDILAWSDYLAAHNEADRDSGELGDVPDEQVERWYENWESEGKPHIAAEDSPYYHISYPYYRENILREGLLPREPLGGGMGPGVYVYPKHPGNLGGLDTWEIDPRHYQWEPDYNTEGALYSRLPISPEHIRLVHRDGSYKHAWGSKTSKETRPQFLRRWEDIRQRFPDEGQVVHQFWDGHTIQRLNTFGQVGRTGLALNNCWQGHANFSDPNFPLGRRQLTYHSLNDPEGIPIAAFYVNAKENPPFVQDVLAARDKPPKPEHLNMVKQWANKNGYGLEGGTIYDEDELAGLHSESKMASDSDDWWYHYAPTTERARIQQHGLIPARPGLNTERWNADRLDPHSLKTQPEGVYVTTDPNHFTMPHDENFDLWRIPNSQLRDLQKDTRAPHAYIIPHGVWPELHTPYENSELFEGRQQRDQLNRGELPPEGDWEFWWGYNKEREGLPDLNKAMKEWNLGRPNSIRLPLAR